MSLRAGRSADLDFASLNNRSEYGGGKILGTLVYIVKHEKISSILNESEHVAKIDIWTDYKKRMGGDWERCSGALNLYQLDGPEGHRFVISLYWDKKWYKKLRKVFGVKTSVVDRHTLLEMLCLIEETRRLRTVYMFDCMQMYGSNESRDIGTISEEPEKEKWERDDLDAAGEELISIKKNEKQDLEKEFEEIESKDETENEEIATQNGTASDKENNVETENDIGTLERKKEKEIERVDDDGNEKVEDKQTPNGHVLEVELHQNGDPTTERSSNDRKLTAQTLEDDLSAYNEGSFNSLSSSRAPSEYSPILKNPKKLNGFTDETDNAIAVERVQTLPHTPQRTQFHPLTRSSSQNNAAFFAYAQNPHKSPKPSRKSGASSLLDKIISKVRSSEKKRSLSGKIPSRNVSKLALYETASLKSSFSIDALSMSSMATITGPTGNRNYNRKYFKGRPASMHVLTRDRKFIPIYDVINCLLEFHDVIRPVKIIGVNSETPHSEDLAENQIMELVYFLQKPVNLELRLTRKDYVLYNSVVKLRSFSSSELKILFSN